MPVWLKAVPQGAWCGWGSSSVLAASLLQEVLSAGANPTRWGGWGILLDGCPDPRHSVLSELHEEFMDLADLETLRKYL